MVSQMTGVKVLVCSLAVWWLHGWVVGGFICAIVVVALSTAWPQSLFSCNTEVLQCWSPYWYYSVCLQLDTGIPCASGCLVRLWVPFLFSST